MDGSDSSRVYSRSRRENADILSRGIDVLDRRTVNSIIRQAVQGSLVTGFRSFVIRECECRKSKMDVLASYDTSSDDEKEGKSQKRPPTSVAEDVTCEHGVRESNVEIPEIKEESKEVLPISPSLLSKREESHRNRRYRHRSGSPGDSPSKHSPTSRRSSREERKGNAQSRSRSRSHSPKIRNSSRSKSPNRSSGRDSGQTDEFGRDLRPRRPPSKEKDLERTHSRSPDKRESKERPRYREQRRSPGRDGREKRPSYRRDRDRDRDGDRDRRDRDRDRRDRDRDRGRHERGRNWSDRRRSNDGGYERSRDRRISGETGRDDKDRDDKDSKSPEPSVAPKPPPKPVVLHLQGNRPLTSEEIQAKLAAQAEIMKSQAQQAATALNMPSYLNPSVVNPQQYAVQAQKRKLLWSTKNNETPTAAWNATSFTNDTSGEVQAKFRRLMGIKEGEAGQQDDNPNTDNSGTQSKQLMDDLQNEFERSRAFQLSRGAGGKSGIGLGYTGM